MSTVVAWFVSSPGIQFPLCLWPDSMQKIFDIMVTVAERLFVLYTAPLVLWHCWLGVRLIIRAVKIEWWGVDMVICLERGADWFLHMVQLMPQHPETPSSLASFKSRLVLPFWYWLTQVVLEKRPFNGCSISSSCCCCFSFYIPSLLSWQLASSLWTCTEKFPVVFVFDYSTKCVINLLF